MSKPRKIKNELSVSHNQYTLTRLMALFKSAVGKENGVTLGEVYHAVYGKSNVNNYVRLYRVSVLYNAIQWLKRNTNYFIISGFNDEQRVWFVASNINEANNYSREINNRIAGLKKMEKMCYGYVKNKGYKLLDQPKKLL